MSTAQVEGDEYDLVDVPSVAEYKKALMACRDAGTFKKGVSPVLPMLEAHWAAPEHTLMAGDLAEAVGLNSVVVANGHYGRFAKKLAAQLGREKPESRATQAGKAPVWTAFLVKFSNAKEGPRRNDDESIKLTLIPELAEALGATFFSHLKDR